MIATQAEELTLIFRTNTGNRTVLITPMLWRWKQVDPWAPLASQPTLLGEHQDNKRLCPKQDGWHLGGTHDVGYNVNGIVLLCCEFHTSILIQCSGCDWKPPRWVADLWWLPGQGRHWAVPDSVSNTVLGLWYAVWNQNLAFHGTFPMYWKMLHSLKVTHIKCKIVELVMALV